MNTARTDLLFTDTEIAQAAETAAAVAAFDDPAPFRVAFPRAQLKTTARFEPPANDAFPDWVACRGED